MIVHVTLNKYFYTNLLDNLKTCQAISEMLCIVSPDCLMKGLMDSVFFFHHVENTIKRVYRINFCNRFIPQKSFSIVKG